jgi:hypothetical protein
VPRALEIMGGLISTGQASERGTKHSLGDLMGMIIACDGAGKRASNQAPAKQPNVRDKAFRLET